MENLDALFEQYAEKSEAEAKAAANRGNSTFSSNYEEIKWTGLEANKPKIVRAVGGPPDSNVSNYTAKNCTIAWIVGDDGSRFKAIRPSFNEEPSYILNRIISKINTIKWVNGEKTFPVKENHPELFNLIEKNGLKEGDKRYVFERGWRGKEVLIVNVIDREQMEWHREHKHTMLLAKSVSNVNDREFVDEGVSSFSINPKLSHFFKSYGSWEKYDLAITRTGIKENPYVVVNATNNYREVDKNYQQFISSEEKLTDEERSWEKYDLAKIYKPTSVIKIYNRLKNTIKRIDSQLGTNFLEELSDEVAREKKRLDAENAMKDESPVSTVTSEPIQEKISSQPKVRQPLANPVEVEEEMAFIDSLSPSIRSKIKSASHTPNLQSEDHWDIDWDCEVEELASCPVCGTYAPIEGVTKCPACGEEF